MVVDSEHTDANSNVLLMERRDTFRSVCASV